MDQLTKEFLEKFAQDKRHTKEKLKDIGLAKNTWISLKRSRMKPAKKTIETMRAYLENRRPKFEFVKDGEFYCCTCEQVKPISNQNRVDRWTCKTCSNKQKTNWRQKNWPNFLAFKRNRNLKIKYGNMGPVMRTYLEIRMEIKKYERQTISIGNAGNAMGHNQKTKK